MINKIHEMKIFNDLMNKLFSYLMETFPLYRSDVMLSKTSMEMIRMGNPRLVIEQFVEYISPYEDKLMNCDEKFFINFDKNCKVQNEHLMYGLKLKGIWQSSNIEDAQKALIWLYFQKLFKLGKQIIN